MTWQVVKGPKFTPVAELNHENTKDTKNAFAT
jgi:hypothetical protein